MTSNTFINPDGKLITHKKYVNWEGFREVEGVEKVRLGRPQRLEKCVVDHYDDINGYLRMNVDFTIQD